jgi:hypothetical protein
MSFATIRLLVRRDQAGKLTKIARQLQKSSPRPCDVAKAPIWQKAAEACDKPNVMSERIAAGR